MQNQITNENDKVQQKESNKHVQEMVWRPVNE